jgi:hypothetical protein
MGDAVASQISVKLHQNLALQCRMEMEKMPYQM